MSFSSFLDLFICLECWVLPILNYTRHSWPRSSEGSLACHTYCDLLCTCFSSSMTRDTHTCGRAFSSGAITTCFYDGGLSRLGFEHQTFSMQGECQRRHPRCHYIRKKSIMIMVLLSTIEHLFWKSIRGYFTVFKYPP